MAAPFDKTDKKLCILGRKELEWYGKGMTTNKQYKTDQRNTYYCAKKDTFSVAGHV